MRVRKIGDGGMEEDPAGAVLPAEEAEQLRRPGRITDLKFVNSGGKLSVNALKLIHRPGNLDGEEQLILPHRHDFYELVVVERGSGFHLCNGECARIFPGMVFLLHPRTDWHYYRYREDLELLTFLFKAEVPDFLGGRLRRFPGFRQLFEHSLPGGRRLSSAAVAALDIINSDISRELSAIAEGSELFVMLKLFDALVLIMRNMQDIDDFRASGNILGPALNYMMRNFHDKMSMKMLAQMTNLSESSFFHKFHAEFGLSPGQWLCRYRIRRAMEFLLRADMLVSDVAYAVGFGDPFYFTRQFRRFAGCSPREYRQRNHGRGVVIGGKAEEAPREEGERDASEEKAWF